MNLTGTMIWADFWSATEPNLAILCVSLPMLGTLLTRLTSRRGASKLENYRGDESGTASSAFSRLKERSQANETQIPLENIYAANQEVHYQSVVATDGNGRAPVDRDRDSGSEVALTMEQGQQQYKQAANAAGGGIRVQTKWTISHN